MQDDGAPDNAEAPAPGTTILLPLSASGALAAQLVDRVLDALEAHPETRGLVPPTATDSGRRYVALAELDGRAPAAGVPFLNEAIGALSLPTAGPGAAQAVREALAGVDDGLRVEEEQTYTTQA